MEAEVSPSKDFLELGSLRKLAFFLGLKYQTFIYYLYKIPEKDRYKEFTISKRNGGARPIVSPNKFYKSIQRKLNDTLQDIYKPKSNVHGFVKNRNIK